MGTQRRQLYVTPHSTLKMRTLFVLSVVLVAGCLCQESEETETTSRPQCEGFTCPNNDQEGGLFALGCSGDFCDCSYGVPYLKHCDEANPPLFFNEPAQVCDWCFTMCDECANECSACK